MEEITIILLINDLPFTSLQKWDGTRNVINNSQRHIQCGGLIYIHEHPNLSERKLLKEINLLP